MECEFFEQSWFSLAGTRELWGVSCPCCMCSTYWMFRDDPQTAGSLLHLTSTSCTSPPPSQQWPGKCHKEDPFLQCHHADISVAIIILKIMNFMNMFCTSANHHVCGGTEECRNTVKILCMPMQSVFDNKSVNFLHQSCRNSGNMLELEISAVCSLFLLLLQSATTTPTPAGLIHLPVSCMIAPTLPAKLSWTPDHAEPRPGLVVAAAAAPRTRGGGGVLHRDCEIFAKSSGTFIWSSRAHWAI